MTQPVDHGTKQLQEQGAPVHVVVSCTESDGSPRSGNIQPTRTRISSRDHAVSADRDGNPGRATAGNLPLPPSRGAVPQDGSDDVSECLQWHIGEQNYRHWFEGRSRFTLEGDQLQVYVASPFIASWLLKRFRKPLAAAAVKLLGPSGAFSVQVDSSLKGESASPTGRQRHSADSPRSPKSGDERTLDEPVGDAPIGDSRSGTSRRTGRRRFRSFQTLVAGPCNELALMAARRTAESPGDRLNPLYLYGPTGVGKTHLLEAIYTDLRRHRSELNVLFLTSEAFTNYFTNALSCRSVPSFRQRFRSVDVLLIDNIEFLGNKKATQEEFLHTIDRLMDHEGQLVLTSDRHPRLLTRHREELTTRFVSGLVCRIEAPAECTRRTMIDTLTLPHRGQLSRETLEYLVRHGGRNARELQGAVNCLVSHAALRGGNITAAQARSLLGELEQECRHLVRISDVERIVCEAFGVTVQDLRSKSRRKAVSCPRSVAMYVARKLTKAAWREIGQYFGGRDHSTVVAAAKRVEEWMVQEADVGLPNSCRGITWNDVVREIEERLLALVP